MISNLQRLQSKLNSSTKLQIIQPTNT